MHDDLTRHLVFFMSRWGSADTLCYNCEAISDAVATLNQEDVEYADQNKGRYFDSPAHFHRSAMPAFCPICLRRPLQMLRKNEGTLTTESCRKQYLSLEPDGALTRLAKSKNIKSYFSLMRANIKTQVLLDPILQAVPCPDSPTPSGGQSSIVPTWRFLNCPYLARACNCRTIYLAPDPLASRECLEHTIGSAIIFRSFLGLLLLGQKTRIEEKPKDISRTLATALKGLLNLEKDVQILPKLRNLPVIPEDLDHTRQDCQHVTFLPIEEDTETAFRRMLATLSYPSEVVSPTIDILKNPALAIREIRLLGACILANPFIEQIQSKVFICNGQSVLRLRSTKEAKNLLEKKTAALHANDSEQELQIRILFSKSQWDDVRGSARRCLARLCSLNSHISVWSEDTQIDLPIVSVTDRKNDFTKSPPSSFVYSPDSIPVLDTKDTGEQGVRRIIYGIARYIMRGPLLGELDIVSRWQNNTPERYHDSLIDAFRIERIVTYMGNCLGLQAEGLCKLPEVLSRPQETRQKEGKKIPRHWFILGKDAREDSEHTAHNASRYVAIAFATLQFLLDGNTVSSDDIRKCSRMIYRKLRDNFPFRQTAPDAKRHRKPKYENSDALLADLILHGSIFTLSKKRTMRRHQTK